MESNGGYLEKHPFFDWEPVKFSEKWFNVLMSAFAKDDFGCMRWIFFETAHLIRGDVNE